MRRACIAILFGCSVLFLFPLTTPAQGATACKLLVNSDGVYLVTGRQLMDAGIDLSLIDPRRLRLTCAGEPIPYAFAGGGDGVWDPHDALEFYGRHVRGTYSLYGEYGDTNVYWLEWTGSVGARMSTSSHPGEQTTVPISQYRARLHLEEDRTRVGLGYADEKRDHWYWKATESNQLLETPFWAQDVLSGSELTLRVRLHGWSLKAHDVQVQLNGIPVGEIQWYGQQEVTFISRPIQASVLTEGLNHVGLLARQAVVDETTLPDRVYLNWIELDYSRQLNAIDDELEFDPPGTGSYEFQVDGFTTSRISIHRLPGTQITDFTVEESDLGYRVRFADTPLPGDRYYLIASERKKSPAGILPEEPTEGWQLSGQLRSPNNQADYLIITYDEFYDAVLPLAKLRNQQFRTVVVKVQDIYDEFNGGRLSPDAIRDFLRFAYQHWQRPALQYVLLVGDANWNFRRGKNYVPTSYFHSYKWGQAATDHHYACLQGNDLIPDVAVGRLPVQSVEDTEGVVQKILRYERQPVIDDWRQRALFIAARGSFQQDTEAIMRDYLSPAYLVQRVYTEPKSPLYGSTPQVLDYWNEGVGLVHFTGHGGGSIWSDEGIFKLEDVDLLLNGERTPVVMSFTCFTGYFDDPGKQGLNERLVLKPHGGAIAATGSTGLGWVKGDYYLEQALFEKIMLQRERRLGPALEAAKIKVLAEHPGSLDVVRLYNLLGDPAIRMPIAPTGVSVTGTVDEVGRVQVQGTAPMSQGDVVIDIRTEEGRRLMRRETTLKEGRFSLTEEVPRKDVPAYSVHVYASSGTDEAMGGALLLAPGQALADLAIVDEDIRFEAGDGNTIHLFATVENRGVLAARSVRVVFYEGDPLAGGWNIGETQIPEIRPGERVEAEIVWQTTNEAATIAVRIDPSAQIPENDETNNLAQRRFVFYTFEVSPTKGSKGSSRDGILSFFIAPQALAKEHQLGVESISVVSPEQQPDLTPVPLPNGVQNRGYRLTLVDSESASLQTTLTFRYADGTDPTGLAIYRLKEDTGFWRRLLQSKVLSTEQSVTVEASAPGSFVLFRTLDAEPPRIQIVIKDSQFEFDGELASSHPTFEVIAEDANGVGEVRLSLDGLPVPVGTGELTYFQGGRAATAVYTPILADGLHELVARATDLNGNTQENSLQVVVGEALRLKSVANRPNPVVGRDTWFTYVLTRAAQSGNIRIYGTSGRLIAELEDIPVEQGYNEVQWDVTDRDGDAMANGVYLYKLSVTLENGEKQTYVSKMAVAQ